MTTIINYGVCETSPLSDFGDNKPFLNSKITLDWNDARLGRVVRLRLLSSPGFGWWDVSYCWGLTVDGEPCIVRLPFDQLTKGVVQAQILFHARRDSVFAKRLGFFVPGVISKLN